MADVVELIMNDHREVERLFEELRDPSKRPGALPVLVTLLTAHSRAEEQEVYPVVRDEAGAADDVAHSQTEHAEADELLQQLSDTDPESPEFDTVLEQVVKSITHHVEEEESTVLPAMSSGLSEERRSELADAFLSSRKEHLGDTPEDITLKERQVQARNAEIPGASSKSKDQLAKELKQKAQEEE